MAFGIAPVHRTRLSVLTLWVCALLLSLPAWGQTAPPPQQIALSQESVARFLQSYGRVKELCKKYDQKWADQDFADPQSDGGTRLRQSLEAHGARDAFNRVVKPYGFSGLEEWWATAYSAMLASAFADPAHDPAMMKAKLDRALAQIKQNLKLSKDQKAKYAASLRQSLQRYEALRPPAANIDAIRPFAAQLRLLSDSSD